MPQIADQAYLLTRQYRDASNLEARIALHARFSTNTYGYYSWIFDHLVLLPHSRILELGCGTGRLWLENVHRMPEGWDVTLSDFSPGMVQEAQQNLYDSHRPFTFAVIDAQAIPYEDESFDGVIANHMLYHVLDRPQAVDEIRRVLRPGGRLYASTNGRAHLRELSSFVPEQSSDFSHGLVFDLENGRDQLAPWFSTIVLHRYDDALVVTKAEPLIAYFLSTRIASALDDEARAELARRVEQELAAHGAIHVTKDIGLFEAWKHDSSESAVSS
ncbi:MAG TPA: class I SAM-dependent methyltransferase [Chloroflexota bacterium]|nr:class I SAM-dependent methyltransferase [Chloroflexota bacterium]